ncbi:MAG: hypothetical protein HPY62_00420 [Bacteroidales bacterium]|nr:hypothetical protein [Bacteroidales bacterium]
MRRHYLSLILVTMLSTAIASSQYYETGQDPASLKWMQIKTEHFRLIYPESYSTEGINYAKTLEGSYSKLAHLYPGQRFRIPVIIHSHTVRSNGYVAWAPKRIELYPTPEQDGIPLDPAEQLAIHELTHAFQMQSLNQGFTKVFSVLFGQQFAGVVSATLPLWYLEGDAVFNESYLTLSGRGRSPSFIRQLKAISLEKGKMYSYDKMMNGSFRDFIPSYYNTGYQMVTWSKIRYGNDLWNKTLKSTANFPFLINPVNLSLSRNASTSKKKLYQETFDTLFTIWSDDDPESEFDTYEILNPIKKDRYVSYHSPVMAGSDSVIAIKTSLSDPPSIVLIRMSDKKEFKLHTPGRIYPRTISYGQGKLVWTETQPDPRWENREWSVIKMMDLKSRITSRISYKTRYMSAAISHDGVYIAVTENSADNKNSLVFIDSRNGSIVEKVSAPGNAYLQRPQWTPDDSEVAVIYLTENGEGILTWDISSHSWSVPLKAENHDIQACLPGNDSLFFISSYSGTDNIYFLNDAGQALPLTRSRFGITDLAGDGKFLIFTDYTSDGSNICRMAIPDKIAGTDLHVTSSSFLINKFDTLRVSPRASQNNLPHLNPVPYRKWQNLFNFHSWMPFYADLDKIQSDPASIKPGFSIMSQNNLSTLVSSLGYEYSDRNHKFHSLVKWMGWYFVLESRLDYGHDVEVQTLESSEAPLVTEKGIAFKNTLSLPLVFSGGSFSQFLQLSVTSDFRNKYIYQRETRDYDAGQNQLTGRIYFSNYYRSSLRDIYPRWAQVIDISHTAFPFDSEIYGTSTTLRSAFFCPGILKNNGIKIRLEGENQNPEKFILGNRASFSRSYVDIVSEKLRFASIDYYMSLAYPDFHIGSLLYLPRLRADLFYDYTEATGNYYLNRANLGGSTEFHNYRETFRSYGVELMSDFYLLRIPFMISGGIQASWRQVNEAPYLKLLLNIDIYGMNIGKRGL